MQSIESRRIMHGYCILVCMLAMQTPA
eukprot:COSAG02_NODE_30616_length_548_cov_0.688196_2_plen_26_part_01